LTHGVASTAVFCAGGGVGQHQPGCARFKFGAICLKNKMKKKFEVFL
jgi:hypothetical protein